MANCLSTPHSQASTRGSLAFLLRFYSRVRKKIIHIKINWEFPSIPIGNIKPHGGFMKKIMFIFKKRRDYHVILQ
jgi:hypothetical protein